MSPGEPGMQAAEAMKDLCLTLQEGSFLAVASNRQRLLGLELGCRHRGEMGLKSIEAGP